jgi:hypothetical protein
MNQTTRLIFENFRRLCCGNQILLLVDNFT